LFVGKKKDNFSKDDLMNNHLTDIVWQYYDQIIDRD
jgi:hypothetical protein